MMLAGALGNVWIVVKLLTLVLLKSTDVIVPTFLSLKYSRYWYKGQSKNYVRLLLCLA